MEDKKERNIKKKENGYRKLAFDNLPNKCRICGTNKDLTVHHEDWDKHNNSIDNLSILCFDCHMNLHQKKRLNKKTLEIISLRKQLAKKDSSYSKKLNLYSRHNKLLQEKLKKRLNVQRRNHDFVQVLKDNFPEIHKEVINIYKLKKETII